MFILFRFLVFAVLLLIIGGTGFLLFWEIPAPQLEIEKEISKDKLFQDKIFLNWHQQWQTRLKQNKKPIELSLNMMRTTNPLIIPRNHKVEESLDAANIGDLVPMYNLLEVLKKPYESRSEISAYRSPPAPASLASFA